MKEFPKIFFVVMLSKDLVENVTLNPLQPGVAFLYPLKISENLKVCNGLSKLKKCSIKRIFSFMDVDFIAPSVKNLNFIQVNWKYRHA